jgi:hypothetical protein
MSENKIRLINAICNGLRKLRCKISCCCESQCNQIEESDTPPSSPTTLRWEEDGEACEQIIL